MKKIIIAAILVIAGGLAAAPFFIGSKIESTTKQQAQLAEQRLQQAIQTSPYLTGGSFMLEGYEKSYLSATAQGRLRLNTVFLADDAGESLVIDIPLTSQITHGPYLGGGVFGLAKVVSRPNIAQMELPASIVPDTLTIEDTIDFSGQVHEVVTVLPVIHTADDGTTIEFAGGRVDITTSLSNRLTFSGTVAVEDIKIDDAERAEGFYFKPFVMSVQGKGDAQLNAGDYQLSSEAISAASKRGLTLALASVSMAGRYLPVKEGGLVLGQQEMVLTDIQINDPTAVPNVIKVPELSVNTTATQDASGDLKFSMSYDATLDPTVTALLQIPIDIKTASLDMRFSSIPVSLLEAYTALANDPTFAKSTDDEQATAAQVKMIALAQQAINSSATAFAGVELKNDEGALQTELDLSFAPESELSDEDVLELMTRANESPAALLEVMVGKGHLHLDKSITDQAGLTPLVLMMGAGFVELEDDAFKSELLLRDGQVLVNGQPVPLFAVGMGAEIPSE